MHVTVALSYNGQSCRRVIAVEMILMNVAVKTIGKLICEAFTLKRHRAYFAKLANILFNIMFVFYS